MDGIRKKKMSDGIRHRRRKTSSSNNREEKILEEKIVFSSDFSNADIQKKIKKISRKNNEKKGEKVFQRKEKVIQKSQTSFFLRHKNILKYSFFVFTYFSVLFFIFNSIDNTQVDIYAKTQKIQGEENIFAYKKPSYGQLAFYTFSVKDSLSQKVKAKTKIHREKKAQGTIKIFNNYSREPQRLSPKTRFRSVSGKIFMLGDQGVVIPGKTKDAPGEVEAIVYAEKAGEAYNIDLTDFTLPGFKESGLNDKYQNIYGLSLKKFSGGFLGSSLIVGEKQKDQVVKSLEIKLKKNLLEKLSREKTDRVLLVKDSVQISFKEAKIEKDGILQEAVLSSLLVKKYDAEQFLKRKIFKKTYGKDVNLKDFSNISFSYLSKDTIDFSSLKKIQLHMKYKNMFVWGIDSQLLSSSLYGLNKNDIFTVLKELEEVQEAEISIFPPWQKYISEKKERIRVNVIDG